MISCSYRTQAAEVYVAHFKAGSSLTLHEIDVTPFLTLNHLLNTISSAIIIADNESELQKHRVLTVLVHEVPPVTFN